MLSMGTIQELRFLLREQDLLSSFKLSESSQEVSNAVKCKSNKQVSSGILQYHLHSHL